MSNCIKKCGSLDTHQMTFAWKTNILLKSWVNPICTKHKASIKKLAFTRHHYRHWDLFGFFTIWHNVLKLPVNPGKCSWYFFKYMGKLEKDLKLGSVKQSNFLRIPLCLYAYVLCIWRWRQMMYLNCVFNHAILESTVLQ